MNQRMWEADYSHSWLAHRHRCKGTKLVHIECADKPHPCGTYRHAIIEWSKL